MASGGCKANVTFRVNRNPLQLVGVLPGQLEGGGEGRGGGWDL